MANFVQGLANAGRALSSGMNEYDSILERKRQMELAEIQRRALMQQQQMRDVQMQRDEAQRQAQGQAFAAMAAGAQPPQPGVPQQVPMAGAQPMPQPPPPMAGPPRPPMPAQAAPVQPGAPGRGAPPSPPGSGAAAPQAPQVPPAIMASVTQGLTPNAFDVTQLVAQINKNPATKDLPDDQKFLVLQNMQGALSNEGKAQLEILKQQHQLEIAQAKLDAASERLKDNEQFRLLYEGVRQGNRKDLASQQDDARAARLKARMDQTSADKEAKKPLEGLKADRTELNDEIKGIRGELTELGTGLNQPQPGTPDYQRMLELRSQLKEANGRLQEIDKQISTTSKAPAAAPGAAPGPSTKFTVGQGYTDGAGNTMYFTGKNPKDPSADENWSDKPPGE